MPKRASQVAQSPASAKRAQVAQSPASAKRAAKKAEPESSASVVACKLFEQVSGGLPDTCAEMLRAAIPHMLSKKEERHTFQENILNAFSGLQDEEDAKRRAAIVAAQGEVDAFIAEKETAGGRLDTAKATEASKAEEKNAKNEVVKEKTQASEAAVADRDAQLVKAAEADASVETAKKEKQEYESKLASAWEPVQACTFEKKDWRNRNKAIDVAVGCLRKAGAPESLLAALPVVLKAGSPESRDEFAKAVIEHSESAFKGHVQGLGANVEKLEGGVTEQKAVVEAAEEKVKQTQAELDAAMQEAIDAENAWGDANGQVFDLEKTISGFEKREAALAAKLQKATAALESFHALQAKFVAELEGKAEPAVAEGSEAAAAPAEQAAEQTA